MMTRSRDLKDVCSYKCEIHYAIIIKIEIASVIIVLKLLIEIIAAHH